MTDAELLAILDFRQALIVHLSHHANMRPGGVFPIDLKDAIANKDCWSLSCVVVWPGHPMNLPGSIGVIFRPRSTANVRSISHHDSGSYELADGTDLSGGLTLSAETLEQTFQVQQGFYNEWRLKGADVMGIFVAQAWGLQAKKRQSISVDGEIVCETIALVPIPLEEVFSSFPDLPVYTMKEQGYIRLCPI